MVTRTTLAVVSYSCNHCVYITQKHIHRQQKKPVDENGGVVHREFEVTASARVQSCVDELNSHSSGSAQDKELPENYRESFVLARQIRNDSESKVLLRKRSLSLPTVHLPAELQATQWITLCPVSRLFLKC